MYTPPAFREDDPAALAAMMRETRLPSLVTATAEGLMATPLPLILAEDEGPHGTLYGHLAKANPQWKTPVLGQAMVIFQGPEAYVSPNWYAAKAAHHKVVPTWNYVTVHAYGTVEFFEDADRLLDIVTRLTTRYEAGQAVPWKVSDAPPEFIRAHMRGIVGLRLEITRIDGKKKLSQNRDQADREGVAAGLAASVEPADRALGGLIPV
ncbi:FMN-binding negative transcriptional regulator [Acetobacteraceae bacterium H6797]|nr:FMN-binding negative transcriptional regulator [Acetobacteraceae bacterium H6797]